MRGSDAAQQMEKMSRKTAMTANERKRYRDSRGREVQGFEQTARDVEPIFCAVF